MISALYEHFPHLLVRLNFFFSSKSLTFHSGLSENTVLNLEQFISALPSTLSLETAVLPPQVPARRRNSVGGYVEPVLGGVF